MAAGNAARRARHPGSAAEQRHPHLALQMHTLAARTSPCASDAPRTGRQSGGTARRTPITGSERGPRAALQVRRVSGA